MRLFEKSKTRQILQTNKSNILDFEVVRSKTSVINLEDQPRIVCNADKDLDRKKRSSFRKEFVLVYSLKPKNYS